MLPKWYDHTAALFCQSKSAPEEAGGCEGDECPDVLVVVEAGHDGDWAGRGEAVLRPGRHLHLAAAPPALPVRGQLREPVAGRGGRHHQPLVRWHLRVQQQLRLVCRYV